MMSDLAVKHFLTFSISAALFEPSNSRLWFEFSTTMLPGHSTLKHEFPQLTPISRSGNTKGGSITVPLTSYLSGLESAVWQLTIFVFICKTGLSKPTKQEVNGTVILSPFSIPCPVTLVAFEVTLLTKSDLKSKTKYYKFGHTWICS